MSKFFRVLYGFVATYSLASIGACSDEKPTAGLGAACSTFGATCSPGLECIEGFCQAIATDSSSVNLTDGGTIMRPDVVIPDERDGNVCADVEIDGRPVTPTVLLLVDQSGSMGATDFAGMRRWDAVRETLTGNPDGVVFEFDSQVRFGLTTYSADSTDSGEIIGECPLLTQVDPAIDNYSAIDATLDSIEPLQETPTGASINALVDQVIADPDRSTDPYLIILATDGEPDLCTSTRDTDAARDESLAATERARAEGISLYVISVGMNSIAENHLQDLANAGIGASSGAPYWVAGDAEGLHAAMEEIVGAQITCEVNLNGMLTAGSECDGTVTLNEEELGCNDTNGWRLVDEDTIELMGSACDTWKAGLVDLEASWPCDAAVLY